MNPFIRLGSIAGLALAGAIAVMAAPAVGAQSLASKGAGPESQTARGARVDVLGAVEGATARVQPRTAVPAGGRRSDAVAVAVALAPAFTITPSRPTSTAAAGRRAAENAPEPNAATASREVAVPVPAPIAVGVLPEPNHYLLGLAGLGLILWVVQRHKPT